MTALLGNLSFAAPWALAACLLLPLLWQLLRVTPPKPIIIPFPAIRLLQELSTTQQLATKTPWWVLLLRTLIALCLILAMAQPILNQHPTTEGDDRPLVIVLDNDWSVMDRFDKRRTELGNLLDQAKLSDQNILLVQTALNDFPVFESASDVQKKLTTLSAQPWPADRKAALNHLTAQLVELGQPAKIIWISNGLTDGENTFINNLHQLGDVEIVRDPEEAYPQAIRAVKRTDTGFQANLSQVEGLPPQKASLQILDDQANVLYQQELEDSDAPLDLILPVELRNRASQFRIKSAINPAAQYLLDEKWRDRPVGIIDRKDENTGLLDPAHYILKALRPHAPILKEDLQTILSRDMSLIFKAGAKNLSSEDQRNLENWVSKGGIFIQFANAELAQDIDGHLNPLLPVQLLQGQRTLGGTLSWKRPTSLAGFAENGPFTGLNIPNDITIKRQILARPEANLSEKTWARLKDGTPLITAKPIGRGWTVLFHVTAIPNWSNLPLSGTFELMMMRLLTLSAGHAFPGEEQTLLPYRLFDKNGHLVTPYGETEPLKRSKQQQPGVSAKNPPGFYGPENALYAHNLGPTLPPLIALNDIPLGISERGFQIHPQQLLAPWFMFAALLLALIDWVLSVRWLGFAKTAPALIALMIISSTAQANEPDWEKALAAANDMRLAYMMTGDAQMDKTTERGLNGLATILRHRTAVELAPAMGFDPEKDDPSLFPMIYWPIHDRQNRLSETAAKRLNDFINAGGFILMDTMGQKNPQQLTKLTEGIDIGPLQRVAENHVLTRSFYLMKEFPGRYDFDDIWVEAAEDSARDRVSSVLIGNNGWAQAWARDDSLRPLYAVVPGGELQREQAYRFGVNLVMYILSGNYKGDQVHLPAILQRLGL
ncbi:DUF4159 domain-containing protein [Terasakiella sp. A23]|uniref:DUF4159 domain-containing protein n=1 Tax=Terasakiella sp. FCG-A23 TaxID=3080561 RepID=UPI002952AFA3|nr:DUF4159 domain-containing protein [Terasakiella sp. A23]MDV7338415.1 DUF4159 domain-containing protein [Terasakiella sp. A23]